MKKATIDQAEKILKLVSDKNVPKDRLRLILRTGALADLFNPDANFENFDRDGYRKFFGLEPLNSSFIIPIDTVNVNVVDATADLFIVKEFYVVNKKKDAAVRISYLNERFKERFLGKTEIRLHSALRYGELSSPSSDDLIIKEVGGSEKARISLAETFFLLKNQPNGNKGPLLTNGYANIFYIEDEDDILEVVNVRYCRGWRIGAYPINNLSKWGIGRLIFYHPTPVIA